MSACKEVVYLLSVGTYCGIKSKEMVNELIIQYGSWYNQNCNSNSKKTQNYT